MKAPLAVVLIYHMTVSLATFIKQYLKQSYHARFLRKNNDHGDDKMPEI